MQPTPSTPAAPPSPDRPRPGGPEGGHTAPFGTRIVFKSVEADGRFELQIVNGDKVLAYAMVDARLADRLAYECRAMAARCPSALATPTPAGRAHDDLETSHDR